MKLTKKVTSDKEGAVPPFPRGVAANFQRLRREDSASCFSHRGSRYCALPRMELCEAKAGQDELGRSVWVAPELKLTKKVTADKEGAGPPLPRIVVERAPEVEP